MSRGIMKRSSVRIARLAGCIALTVGLLQPMVARAHGPGGHRLDADERERLRGELRQQRMGRGDHHEGAAQAGPRIDRIRDPGDAPGTWPHGRMRMSPQERESLRQQLRDSRGGMAVDRKRP